MKFLIVLAAVVAVATCWSIPSEEELANHWQRFKAEHGKRYATPVEETHRMKIFKENAIMISKHNARFEAGEVTFEVGLNQHADLLTHEVVERFNGFRPSMVRKGVRPVHNVSTVISNAHAEVDWRSQGYVTEVKNQGECGSCWSFSTTGSLEGQLFKKTGKLVSLSEQNLVDCSGEYGNEGCNGGLMDAAFQYIQDNGGIDTEESYPYTGKDGSCKFSKANNAGTVVGFVDIKEGSEKDLQDALTTVGPVSVAIDASHWSFQFYKKGIYHEFWCSSKNLDHGVLAVGYGSDGRNKDYWIVKNSWGSSWGEKGFIRMARNKKNHCGIATTASYPQV